MSAFNGVIKQVSSIADQLTTRMIGLGAIAIGLLLSLGLFMHSLPSAFSITTTTQIEDVLLGNIQAESLLVTASQTVNANVNLKRVAKIVGIPVGKTNLVYAAVGSASAGIDMRSVEIVEFEPQAQRVKLHLPEMGMTVTLNPERSETLANYRNWFGPTAGADLYEEAQRQAYSTMKAKACSSDILGVATQNAEVEIRTILTKVGFQQVEFETTPSTCPLA